MQIQVAPLIYSRTLHEDFNQNFAVRPQVLDVNWARGKILPSMRDIKPSDAFIRRVAAQNGDMCLAGISGNAADFVKNYVQNSSTDAEKFFREVHNRKILMFIGYVFKGEGVPEVRDDDLWNFFEKIMPEIWESKSPKTVTVGYDYTFELSPAPNKPAGGEQLNNIEVYSGGKDADEQIWKWCIGKKIEFCSNVNLNSIIKDGGYKVITAAPAFINRLKTESAELKPQPQIKSQPPEKKTPPISTTPRTAPSPARQKNRDSNFSLKMPGIILLAVIIAAIIFLLIRLTTQPATPGELSLLISLSQKFADLSIM